jgi:hypothetical protein
MEISKEGKKFLERCNRIDLLRVISDFKVSRLDTDDEMAYKLSIPVAYFIASSADNMKEAHEDINAFISHMIYVLKKLSDDPEGIIEYVEQRYISREPIHEYL